MEGKATGVVEDRTIGVVEGGTTGVVEVGVNDVIEGSLVDGSCLPFEDELGEVTVGAAEVTGSAVVGFGVDFMASPASDVKLLINASRFDVEVSGSTTGGCSGVFKVVELPRPMRKRLISFFKKRGLSMSSGR